MSDTESTQQVLAESKVNMTLYSIVSIPAEYLHIVDTQCTSICFVYEWMHKSITSSLLPFMVLPLFDLKHMLKNLYIVIVLKALCSLCQLFLTTTRYGSYSYFFYRWGKWDLELLNELSGSHSQLGHGEATN